LIDRVGVQRARQMAVAFRRPDRNRRVLLDQAFTQQPFEKPADGRQHALQRFTTQALAMFLCNQRPDVVLIHPRRVFNSF
jgi:hypothetical protein